MPSNPYKNVQGTHMQHLKQRKKDSLEQLRRETAKGYSTRGMKPTAKNPGKGKKK